MTPSAITTYLHEHLPLTAAMQIAAASWDGRTLVLTAPLAPNINHADTAFGGSISTLAITTGWMLLNLVLEEQAIPNRLLIQDSNIKFLRPIEPTLQATATLPDPELLEEFFTTLRRRRRARLTLGTTVYEHVGLPAATHEGLYVALLY